MSNQEITEKFLNALRKYFSGDMLIDDAVEESGLKSRKQFQFRIKTAYKHNLIIVRRRVDPEKGTKVKDWIRRSRGIAKDMEVYIVNDIPDDDSFFSAAAEKFLGFFKELLLREDKEEINIGIVSGTSATDTVEYAVKDGFWQEVMGETKFKGKTKHGKEKSINIVAICSTSLERWDLDGNANISTLLLAKMLKNKLEQFGFKVTPYGISTELVVLEEDSKQVDERESNKMILRIVDPKRVDPNSKEKSKLDMLIAGVGSSKDEKNVFQKVIRQEMGVKLPERVIGDVGFWPIDKDGNEVEICDANNRRLQVYSLITPEIIRELAGGGGIVMLIARNHRHDEEVPKTIPIRAAIRGGFGNVIFTDEDTANELIREPL
jgi:hypothetical protein